MKKLYLMLFLIFLNFASIQAQNGSPYYYAKSTVPQTLTGQPLQFDQRVTNDLIGYNDGIFFIGTPGTYQIAGTFLLTGALQVNVEVNSSTVYESEGIININLHLNANDEVAFVPFATKVNSGQIFMHLVTPDS